MSGPALTPRKMVKAVRKATVGWRYDVVSIGYPGPVVGGRPLRDTAHLGPGWVKFDFQKAFERPVNRQRRSHAGARELSRWGACCSSGSGRGSDRR